MTSPSGFSREKSSYSILMRRRKSELSSVYRRIFGATLLTLEHMVFTIPERGYGPKNRKLKLLRLSVWISR